MERKKNLLESSIRKLSHRTPQKRIDELIQEKKDIEASVKEQENIKIGASEYHRQKLNQAVKRTAESLIEQNKIKRRKLGAGPMEKIDDEDEEFLLNCIETKATAHGRRHDTVLYLNHSVRKHNQSPSSIKWEKAY